MYLASMPKLWLSKLKIIYENVKCLQYPAIDLSFELNLQAFASIFFYEIGFQNRLIIIRINALNFD